MTEKNLPFLNEVDQIELQKAVDLLKVGELIAYPTEGVYGLGCDPGNEQAVSNLLRIKDRPIEKGLILIADRIERFAPYLLQVPLNIVNSAYILNPADVKNNEDRPITWLVEHGGKAPFWLSGGSNKLAIRITNHPVVQKICALAEMALVSTSANPAGSPAALCFEEVLDYFGSDEGLVTGLKKGFVKGMLKGSVGGQKGSSEIRDYATGKVIREAGSL